MRGQKAGKKLCDTAIRKAAARELHRSPDQDACNMLFTFRIRTSLTCKFDREFAPKGRHAPISSISHCKSC